MSKYFFFNFPESCNVDQRIGKALFADNGPLTPADRRIFRNEIEEIVCSCILDENHGIMLTPFADEEHDYTCLAQIDVFLKKAGKAVRIAELCHRAMPYPLVVILHDGESLMFSMAEKRFSRDGKEQLVLERVVNTDWLKVCELTEFQKATDFCKNRKTSFRELYLHYMELLNVLKCSAITGEFIEEGLAPEERGALLDELHLLEQQITEIKSMAKKESRLPALVELNIKCKALEEKINTIVSKIGQKKI